MNYYNLYHRVMSQLQQSINYYWQLTAWTPDPQERAFYEDMARADMRRLEYWQEYFRKRLSGERQDNQEAPESAPPTKTFTLEELSKYDGAGGRPAYVAVDGVVYDVSRAAAWGGGTHFGQYSGKDLTAVFQGCHNGMLAVLRNLPVVGTLAK